MHHKAISVFDTEISKEIEERFIPHKSTTQFLKQMISSSHSLIL